MDRKLLRRASRGAFRVAVVAPRLSPFGTEVAGALLGIAVILALWLGLTVALVALAPFAWARRGPSS